MRILEEHVDLKVFASRAALRRAIKRLGYGSDRTEAIVIPCTEIKYDKKGKGVKTKLCAKLFITRNTTIPVISHECVHIAATLMRKYKHNLSLGSKIGLREEILAYYQTWALQEVLKHMGFGSNSDYEFTHENIRKWAKASVSSSKKK